MSFALSEILGQVRLFGEVYFLIFLRVGAAMFALPGFGEQMIPVRVRLGVALSFSALLLPVLEESFRVQSLNLIHVGLIEIAAGLFIGIILRTFMHVLQIAGTIAAQSVSLSQILGPTNSDPVPAIGQIMVLGGVTLLMALDFHLLLIDYFLWSYEFWPRGQILPSVLVVEFAIAHVAKAFNFAFSISAPFFIASVIYNLALGAINRAMPQLMVAFVGAPAITGAGIALLFLTLPLIFVVWIEALTLFLSNPMADH